MALKTLTQFPIFAPPYQPHHRHRPATEIRFSRWNNANAQKFIRHERTQKQIEDELRFHKRFTSADKIANTKDDTAAITTTGADTDTFRSIGTPSTPSRPSIPGKFSKYSKPPKPPKRQDSHPAFRRTVRLQELPKEETGIKFGDKGVTYLIPEAPFEFQYSYTETPKAKPVKLRESPIAPFGPSTMPRPWTGRKPLPPSKKKIDFDSFKLPPPHKKGVKPVQSPGPFLPGSGPKYVMSREEILGEPLSKEEIDDLVKGSMKAKRQLNMGRDGLTHNMLDNIHALWKRRRVCKIKCKGVCTVDMDNVRQQLEDKTGGKIIYSRGGVLYLFRGRNYNYKSRPRFPLMLWKPIPPVYPKLIKKTPDGLIQEEASEMRAKGRNLIPICKLAKNGVYCDLVKNVQEAFEACELVRINCQGLNPSDYKKIGAKLMELVPCVLFSFEYEHILMWRGRDWKSSLLIEDNPKEVKEPEIDAESSISSPLEGEEEEPSISTYAVNQSIGVSTSNYLDDTAAAPVKSDTVNQHELESVVPEILNSTNLSEKVDLNSSPTEGILTLLEQAVEGGSAVILDESSLDPDIVYQRAVSLAKSAPPGPVFRHRRPRKVAVENVEKQESENLEGKEVLDQVGEDLGEKEGSRQVGGNLEGKVVEVLERKRSERKSSGKQRKMDIKGEILSVIPQGTLRVDELAKLLA